MVKINALKSNDILTGIDLFYIYSRKCEQSFYNNLSFPFELVGFHFDMLLKSASIFIFSRIKGTRVI